MDLPRQYMPVIYNGWAQFHVNGYEQLISQIAKTQPLALPGDPVSLPQVKTSAELGCHPIAAIAALSVIPTFNRKLA